MTSGFSIPNLLNLCVAMRLYFANIFLVVSYLTKVLWKTAISVLMMIDSSGSARNLIPDARVILMQAALLLKKYAEFIKQASPSRLQVDNPNQIFYKTMRGNRLIPIFDRFKEK